MNYLMSAFIILLVATAGMAHTPTEAPHLTVVATSGLTLRKAPDAHSPAIKIIPYGDQVTIRHDQPDTIFHQRISWVDGEWIVVEHEGDVGFIFDGYLTALPLPSYESEYSPYDLELIYPLQAWMNHHHLLAEQPDTLLRSERSKIIHNYVDGHRMIQSHQHDYYQVEVYLHDARLMDAYHLLLSMLDDDSAAKTFRSASTFIEGSDGAIHRIKVDTDDAIDIRLLGPDLVRIQISSVEHYCKL